MDKYIGFDIDSKKVSVCVIEQGKKDVYATIGPDIGSMKHFLLCQKKDGSRLHLVYEVSGYSGYIHEPEDCKSAQFFGLKWMRAKQSFCGRSGACGKEGRMGESIFR